MANEIVDFNIIRYSHRSYRCQYGARYVLDNGEVVTQRFPGLFGAADKLENETKALQHQLQLEALKLSRTLFGTKRVVGKNTGTCTKAMDAYEQWHGLNRRCNKRIFAWYCRSFTNHFNNLPLDELDHKAASEFVLHLIDDQNYSYDTVRLCITTASGMIEYLRDEKLWSGDNPFEGLLKKYANRFPAAEPQNYQFTEHEWNTILHTVRKKQYWAAQRFIEISRCTGLRPSEVYRLNTETIDRDNLSWRILVTKTAHRPMFRKIAIPRCLLAFLDNTGVNGPVRLAEITVGRQMRNLCQKTEIQILPKRFRKDFAYRMEQAGADPSVINLHQGRGQSGVLFKNYVTDMDRAVVICRPYVARMFGEDRKLARVK